MFPCGSPATPVRPRSSHGQWWPLGAPSRLALLRESVTGRLSKSAAYGRLWRDAVLLARAFVSFDKREQFFVVQMVRPWPLRGAVRLLKCGRLGHL